MFSIKHAPLLLTTMLTLSAHNLHAQTHQTISSDSTTHLEPIAHSNQTTPSDPEELYRYKIIEKTKNVFTLLGAEIAFNQGKNEIALNTYLATLFKTQNPEVAERAMELAISLHEYDVAEQIYQQWKTIEPQSSPAQRRITWARSFALGNTDATVAGLKPVLSEANEDQIRRIFLLLAQNSSNHELAVKSNAIIQEAVQHYPDMNEALITSMLFSSSVGDHTHAQATLQHLITTDPQLSLQTRVALDLAFHQDPQWLIDFFKDNNNKELSIAWKKLGIEILAEAGKKDLAYQQLQTLLNTYSDADLYIQAGLWSYQQNADIQITLNYLEKAFQLGTPIQKSRAAALIAIRLLTDHRYAEAEHWLPYINSPENTFDKIILQISLAIEQEKWAEAAHFIHQGNKMMNKQGLFFNNSDFQQLKSFVVMQNDNSIKHAIIELTHTINHIERQKNSNNAELAQALYQRGMLYSAQAGQFNRAVADLRHFLRLYPNNSAGMNALGYTLLERPEYLNEAYELIKKAYQQEPESAPINDSLGWVYMKKGDAQTALPYLQYAYQQNPNAEVAAHLGETHWALGDRSKAKQIWQEAWNKNKKNRILNDTIKKYGIHF